MDSTPRPPRPVRLPGQVPLHLLAAVALGLAALAKTPPAHAAGGAVDPAFTPGPANLGGGANRVALQADGKVLLAGTFTNYLGTKATGLIRLNTNGTVDAGFNLGSGFQGPTVMIPGVFTNTSPAQLNVVVPTAAGVLVGGLFDKFNATAQANLVRLLPGGALDTAFAPKVDGTVTTVAVQADGRVVIGGGFKNVNGTARTSLARLNANGTLDASFVPAWGPVVAASPRALALLPDGRILVGGSHLVLSGGLAAKALVRLGATGTFDATFQPPAFQFTTEYVLSLRVQDDGHIVVAGLFTTLNGAAHRGLGRLNADGTSDATWPGTGAGTLGFENVNVVAAAPGGQLYVGGHFDTLNGAGPGGIARLNADGSRDTTFQKPAGSSTFWVDGLAVQDDGRVVVAGSFTLGSTVDSTKTVLRLLPEGEAVVPPPTLQAGPDSASFVLNATGKSLSVTASGSPPLSYQWYRNGAALGFQTEATLGFSQVREGDAGDYTVVVTNPGGSVTSVVATVTVLLPARIVTPPAPLSLAEGTAASFSVIAAGTAPLAYQWRRNLEDIPGATQPTLTLPAATFADAGDYSVRVENAAGGETSTAVALTVQPAPPRILKPPVGAVVELPDPHLTAAALAGRRLHLTVLGGLPPWIDHGEYDITFTGPAYASPANGALPNASTGAFTVAVGDAPPATLIDCAGFFPEGDTARLSLLPNGIFEFNRAGLVADQNGRWELLPPFQPPAGPSVTLDVAAAGSEPLSYQWLLNGQPLAGQTHPTLTLASVRAADLGLYSVRISNAGGTLVSDPVEVGVRADDPTGPSLSAPRADHGQLGFRIATVPGRTYDVQTRAGLGAAGWTTVQTLQGDGSVHAVSVPTTGDAGFVRVGRR